MEIQSNATIIEDLVNEIKSTESYINGNRKFIVITPNHNLIREDSNKVFSFPKQHPLEDQTPYRANVGIMYNNQLYEIYTNIWIYGLDILILQSLNT